MTAEEEPSLWRGTLGALIICTATLAISVLDARIAGVAAPAAAGVYAALLALRSRTTDVVALVLWLWLLVPFVRRVVDWLSTYHELSPVLLAPVAGSLAAALVLLRGRGARAGTPATLACGALLAAVLYGSLVGLPRWGALPVAAAAVELVAPLVLGYVVLTHDGSEVARVLPRLAKVAVPVLGAYGILQFLVLPPWDALWIDQSGINSVGQAAAQEVRVFGTLNTAGPYAHTLSALLLLHLAGTARTRLAVQLPVLVLGYVGLGLSLVRSAWICHLLAVGVLVLAGRVRVTRLLAVAVPGAAALLLFGGPVLQAVTDRVTASLEAGAQDYSLQERLELQGRLLTEVVVDPWGRGLGGTGLATQFESSLQPALQNVDSGVFESLVTFGLPAGLLLLGTTVVAAGSAVRLARRGLADPGAAAVLTALTVALLFTSTYKSVYGALLWLAAGVVGHVRPLTGPPLTDHLQDEPDRGPAPPGSEEEISCSSSTTT